jgi:hypothetical protein
MPYELFSAESPGQLWGKVRDFFEPLEQSSQKKSVFIQSMQLVVDMELGAVSVKKTYLLSVYWNTVNEL